MTENNLDDGTETLDNATTKLQTAEEKHAEELQTLKIENALLKMRLKTYEKKDVEYCKKSRCKSNSKKLKLNTFNIKKLELALEKESEAHRDTVKDYNATFLAFENLKVQHEKLEEEARLKMEHELNQLQETNAELKKTNDKLMTDFLTAVSKNRISILENEKQTLAAKANYYKSQLIELKHKCNQAIKCAKHYEDRYRSLAPQEQVLKESDRTS